MQTKYIITNSMISVWPKTALNVQSPTETIDFCLTFQSACDHYLNRIGCPSDVRVNNACNRGGITAAVLECSCGAAEEGGKRISELITDSLLCRGYDLMPFGGYVTLNGTNFCSGVRDLCSVLLDHIQCPTEHRKIAICSDDSNYSTYPSSGIKCACGNLDIGKRVSDNLFDAVVRPYAQSLVYQPNFYRAEWDLCTSFNQICSLFLDKIECPMALRSISACGSVSVGYPYGQVYDYIGSCTCGNLKQLSHRPSSMIVDALLLHEINTKILYLPPPKAPYSLLIASNPYKQLTTPYETVLPN